MPDERDDELLASEDELEDLPDEELFRLDGSEVTVDSTEPFLLLPPSQEKECNEVDSSVQPFFPKKNVK